MFKLEISTGGAAFRDPFSGEEDEVMEAAEIRSLLTKAIIRTGTWKKFWRNHGCEWK